MKATRKRLQQIESALGVSEEHSLRVEYFDISPDGEQIPWPGQSDDRPAKHVIGVCFDYRDATPEEWKERHATLATEPRPSASSSSQNKTGLHKK